MKYYEITKNFRGGRGIYYIALNDNEEVSDEMLESIGDNTDGGERYGFRIDAKEIEKLPPNAEVLPRERIETIY